MKLSVIIPVYNEECTLLEVIRKIKEVDIRKELIIVDDGSNDKTKNILDKIRDDTINIFRHPYNKGKGAAVRTALEYINGDIVIIQDADLEYEPDDYIKLIEPIITNIADIVYGSRFLAKKKVTTTFHYFVNRFLTLITNLLFNSSLTDMETCYKVFKTKIIKELNLESNGFEIEAELTSKVLKRGYKIYEVPIFYRSRSYHEGKKIAWRDGIKTLLAIFKYRLVR